MIGCSLRENEITVCKFAWRSRANTQVCLDLAEEYDRVMDFRTSCSIKRVLSPVFKVRLSQDPVSLFALWN